MTYRVTVSCEKVSLTYVNSTTTHSHTFEALKLGDSAAVQMEALHVTMHATLLQKLYLVVIVQIKRIENINGSSALPHDDVQISMWC